MVFAVACIDKLMIYDTQQTPPIGFVSDIHYSSITDLAWYVGGWLVHTTPSYNGCVCALFGRSDDGRMLAVSSSDGYCSLVVFDEKELGMPLSNDLIPSPLRTVQQHRNASPFSPKPSPPLADVTKSSFVKSSDGESSDSGRSPETFQPMTTQEQGATQNGDGCQKTTDSTTSDMETQLDKPVQTDRERKQPRRVCFTTLSSATSCSGERAVSSMDVS